MLFSPDSNQNSNEDDTNIEISGSKLYLTQLLSFSEVQEDDISKQILDLELFITYVGLSIIQQIQKDLNFLELFHARRHFGFDHFNGETQDKLFKLNGKLISSNKLAIRLMNKHNHSVINSDFIAVMFTRVSALYLHLGGGDLSKKNIIDNSKVVGEFIAEKTLELDPSPSIFSHKALPVQMRIYSMNSASFTFKQYPSELFNPNM